MKLTATPFAVLTALLLFPTWVFGQQNYQPAKITTLAGDTLRGFVDYRGWDKNPRTITFKATEQAPAQTFRPLDIQGFSVQNEQYKGAQVVIETSPASLADLPDSPTPTFRPDTTFLLGVVTGSRSLYQYSTGFREYFYIEQQGKFDLLVYKRFKLPSSNTIVRFNTTYREQLAQYLTDCPAIEQQLKTVGYIANSLQKLFTNYLTCTHQPAVILKKQNAFQAGLLVGVTHTTLDFHTAYPSYIPDFASHTTYSPTGGVYFYLPVPGSLNHFSINNELTFNSYKASNTKTNFTSADNYSIVDNSLQLSYLKLNTIVRFTQPVGAGTIFINAGMSNGYAFRAKIEQTIFQNFYASQQITTKDLFDIRQYEQGLVVGAGGSVKRISAEARYEHSSGFLDAILISSSFNRLSLLLGYRLF